MGQYVTKEEKLSKKIFTDEEYGEIVENFHDKIERIILKHGPFTGPEIDDFVEENLNRPILEEIFNDFKENEGIRNAMKKIWSDNSTSNHAPPDLPRIFRRQ